MNDKKNTISTFIKTNMKYINASSEEEQKMLLYAVFSEIILSKKFFNHNSEIKSFLSRIDIDFKPYVFSSRTQIISRIIRVIQNSENDFRKECFIAIQNIVEVTQIEEEQKNKKDTKPKERKNSVDDIIELFGRK